MTAINPAAERLCVHAAQVAALLKLVANDQRLMLLCRLVEGEASVTELVGLCGQSQSGVSQHLARMREGGIVTTRRDARTIYYSIANADVEALIGFLCTRFGGEDGKAG